MNFKGDIVKDISNFKTIPAYPQYLINKVGVTINKKYNVRISQSKRNKKS